MQCTQDAEQQNPLQSMPGPPTGGWVAWQLRRSAPQTVPRESNIDSVSENLHCSPLPMSDFSSLEAAMRRCVLLATGICTSLLLMTIASLALAFITAGKGREVATPYSPRVVPGNVGDANSPGIPEDNYGATSQRASRH